MASIFNRVSMLLGHSGVTAPQSPLVAVVGAVIVLVL